MTAISKKVYFDVLDDIVNNYNNTVHRTIKIKPIDVTSDSHAKYNEDSNKKDLKFKVSDRDRISNTQTLLLKHILKIGQKKFSSLAKLKNTVPQTYVISDLNGKPITGTFYEKELQKTNQKESRIEKVIKRKGDKLDAKWKEYDNSFSSWVDKKDIV